jgi:hypothetical protein
MYRRQYVWEQLAALYRSPSSESASLDPMVEQITAQACRIPAAASHLVRASGLLPFLAAAARGGGGAWAMACLEGLLARRIGLTRREDSAAVFDAYLQAACTVVSPVVAAATQPADRPHGASEATAPGEAATTVAAALPRALRVLCLLVRAAPGRRELQGVGRALVGPRQAAALVRAVQSLQPDTPSAGASTAAECGALLMALLLHLLPAAPAAAGTDPPEDARCGLAAAEWLAQAVLDFGPAAPLGLDSVCWGHAGGSGGDGGDGGGTSQQSGAAVSGDAPAGLRLIVWLDHWTQQQQQQQQQQQLQPAEAAAARVALCAHSAYASLASTAELSAARAPLLRAMAALLLPGAPAGAARSVGLDSKAVATALADLQAGAHESPEGRRRWEDAVTVLQGLAAGRS